MINIGFMNLNVLFEINTRFRIFHSILKKPKSVTVIRDALLAFKLFVLEYGMF